jgi:CheY-like chemotaxis protein
VAVRAFGGYTEPRFTRPAHAVCHELNALTFASNRKQREGSTVKFDSNGWTSDHLFKVGSGALRLYSTDWSIVHPDGQPSDQAGANIIGAEVRLCSMVLHQSLSNITIVIVEDHPDTLFFLTRFLNREGAKVVAADNSFDGLQAIKTHRPNIVLSDINLPKRDGFELLGDIRALDEPRDVGRLPVIAMTALTSLTYPDHMIGAGFEACLNKPFNSTELIETIQSVLKS